MQESCTFELSAHGHSTHADRVVIDRAALPLNSSSPEQRSEQADLVPFIPSVIHQQQEVLLVPHFHHAYGIVWNAVRSTHTITSPVPDRTSIVATHFLKSRDASAAIESTLVLTHAAFTATRSCLQQITASTWRVIICLALILCWIPFLLLSMRLLMRLSVEKRAFLTALFVRSEGTAKEASKAEAAAQVPPIFFQQFSWSPL
jgi:hypothetical protein